MLSWLIHATNVYPGNGYPLPINTSIQSSVIQVLGFGYEAIDNKQTNIHAHTHAIANIFCYFLCHRQI